MAGFRSRGVEGLLFQLHCKPESGASTWLAFHADLTLHEGHQLLANRQAQAGTPVIARGRTIGLAKRLKELPLSLDGNANSTVFHAKTYPCIRLGFALFRDPYDDLSCLREFEGVADEIGQDLTQPSRISAQSGGQVGRHGGG